MLLPLEQIAQIELIATAEVHHVVHGYRSIAAIGSAIFPLIMQLPDKGIVTRATNQRIAAGSTIQMVIPGTTIQDVFTLTAVQVIIPTLAEENVVPLAAAQGVIAPLGIGGHIEQGMMVRDVLGQNLIGRRDTILRQEQLQRIETRHIVQIAGLRRMTILPPRQTRRIQSIAEQDV